MLCLIILCNHLTADRWLTPACTSSVGVWITDARHICLRMYVHAQHMFVIALQAAMGLLITTWPHGSAKGSHWWQLLLHCQCSGLEFELRTTVLWPGFWGCNHFHLIDLWRQQQLHMPHPNLSACHLTEVFKHADFNPLTSVSNCIDSTLYIIYSVLNVGTDNWQPASTRRIHHMQMNEGCTRSPAFLHLCRWKRDVLSTRASRSLWLSSCPCTLLRIKLAKMPSSRWTEDTAIVSFCRYWFCCCLGSLWLCAYYIYYYLLCPSFCGFGALSFVAAVSCRSCRSLFVSSWASQWLGRHLWPVRHRAAKL
jgi:hypothetical protein